MDFFVENSKTALIFGKPFFDGFISERRLENSSCNKTDGRVICTCDDGFEGPGDICTNINECSEENADKNHCGPNTDCEDLIPGHLCHCSNGFVGVPTDKEKGCVDIDECANGIHDCGTDATCINTDGGFECICDKRKKWGLIHKQLSTIGYEFWVFVIMIKWVNCTVAKNLANQSHNKFY